MALRDFTDEAKQRLLGAVQAAENQDSNWFEREILDGIADWFISDDIADYGNDIGEFHKSLVDKKDTTAEKINSIFDAVYDVENTYSPRFNAQLSKMPELSKAFAAFAEILNPLPADGKSFFLLRAPEEVSAKLAEGTQHIMLGILNSMIEGYDDNGNPIYNWTEIDRILNKDAAGISELEYFALATIYSGMDVADTEKFLQALADKVGDITESNGLLLFHNPKEYTEWSYDSEKIDGIQKYIDMMAYSVTAQQTIISNMSAEELANLYFKMYPDQIGQNIDFEAQRERMIIEIDNQRRALLQQSAFLSIADSLANQATGKESNMSWFSFYSESGNLTGEAGAFGPKISITQVDGDYVFSFCNSSQTIYSNPDTTTIHYNHLNENQIFVSDVLPGPRVVDKVADNMEIYYTAKYSFDFTDTALSSTSNYMRDKIISAALDNIAKSATENMAKGLAKTSIGLIPIAGDIVVFFIDLGLDYSKEKAEAKQNLNEINQSIGALRDANYCNSLRLDAVVVSDGTAYQQVMIYPGSKTKNIIDNINDHFNAQDVAQYGLSYPITVEDALNNSSAVNDLLSGLSNSDFAYVTDPNH